MLVVPSCLLSCERLVISTSNQLLWYCITSGWFYHDPVILISIQFIRTKNTVSYPPAIGSYILYDTVTASLDYANFHLSARSG
jgi:hypothetical protein